MSEYIDVRFLPCKPSPGHEHASTRLAEDPVSMAIAKASARADLYLYVLQIVCLASRTSSTARSTSTNLLIR